MLRAFLLAVVACLFLWAPAFSTDPPTPTSDWQFNDGSGSSAVDDKGVANFSLSGSYTWNSDNLSIDADTAGNIFQLANGGYYNLGSFTVAVWLNFNAVGTTKQIITLGDGAGSGVSNYAFKLDYSGASGPRAYSCNGSSATATTGQGSLVNGTKYLVIAKYTRTGGSADNVLTCRVTSNGTSWSSDTITNAALMQQVSSFELRGGLTDGNGVNAKYYRIFVWDNKVTSTGEDDDIYNFGSEGAFSTGGHPLGLTGVGG